jgi:hypothetical protein
MGSAPSIRQLFEFPLSRPIFQELQGAFVIKKNFRIIAHPRLRDHPLLKYGRVKNWPPVWTRGTKGIVKTVKGHVGVLKEVYYDAGPSNKCFLVIDYQRQSYMGCITCPTRSFCTQLTHFLRDHIGRSIADIGNLDVSLFERKKLPKDFRQSRHHASETSAPRH